MSHVLPVSFLLLNENVPRLGETLLVVDTESGRRPTHALSMKPRLEIEEKMQYVDGIGRRTS